MPLFTSFLTESAPRKHLQTLFVLLTILLITSTPLHALDKNTDKSKKDEIVYVKLSDGGAVKNIYTVNRFTAKKDIQVTDFGEYQNVQALSSCTLKQEEKEKVLVNLSKGIHFYQGENKDLNLPWTYDFSYELNGRKSSPSELKNQSGVLKISFSVQQNTPKKRFSHFQQNFLQQLTITLKGEDLELYHAPQANTALAGSNYVLHYQILPNKNLTGEIIAKAQKWQPEAIEIAAIPFQSHLDIDLPKPQEIINEFAPLHDGLAQLANGMVQLNSGFQQGLTGLETLHNGLEKLAENGQLFSDGLFKLDESLGKLYEGSLNFQSGLSRSNTGGKKLADTVRQAKEDLQQSLPTDKLSRINQAITDLLPLLKQLADNKENTVHLSPERIRKQIDQLRAFQQRIELLTTEITDLQKTLEEQTLAITASREELTALFNNPAPDLSSGNQEVTDLLQKQEELKTYLEYLPNLTAREAEIIQKTLEQLQLNQHAFLQWQENVTSLSLWQNTLYKLQTEAEKKLEDLERQNAAVSTALKNLLSDTDWQKLTALTQELDSILHLAENLLSLLPQPPENNLAPTLLSKLIEELSTIQDLLNKIPSFTNGMDELERGLQKLSDGLNELDTNFSLFSSGIAALKSGAGQLDDGFLRYQYGINKAAEGSGVLQKGLHKLKDGAVQLENGLHQAADKTTQDKLGAELKKKFERLTQSILPEEYKPESFASPKNKNITTVQFVILTENNLQIKEPETVIAEEKPSLWELFLNLFR